MISLKHISTLSTFNQTKFSADSTDSSYFLGSDQTQIFQGTPDVKYNDLCYIKCSNLQYTHGHLYGSTEVGEAHVSLTQEEYDALSEEEKNNGKIYLIKESTIPDLIDQLPTATTTTNGLMSAEDHKILHQTHRKIGNHGLYESGKFEDIIRSVMTESESGYFYADCESITGGVPFSSGWALISYYSNTYLTGIVILTAQALNSNSMKSGRLNSNSSSSTASWTTVS